MKIRPLTLTRFVKGEGKKKGGLWSAVFLNLVCSCIGEGRREKRKKGGLKEESALTNSLSLAREKKPWKRGK